MSEREWLELGAQDFGPTEALQLGLFVEPDAAGTLDLFGDVS